MKSKTLITSLALTTLMGATLALPTTASAHEVVREVIIKPSAHAKRYAQPDRWYLERHREARSAWAAPRYGYKHQHKEKYAKHHARRYERIEYREYRPVVEQRVIRHRDDGALRIRIGYDFTL